jgi:UDP-2,3-diacylglucosamine pyrophosphatase LpxH
MGRKKYKIIVGDLHLGTGKIGRDGFNPFESFYQDERFIEFLEHHTRDKYEGAYVELILNGDTFSMLGGDEILPPLLEENTSAMVLTKIMHGHREVIEALRKFSERENTMLTFLVGEYDIGLLWPVCETLLKDSISNKIKVMFGPYETSGFRIEHGNQFDVIHRFNKEDVFSSIKKGGVLKLPYGPLFIHGFINELKKQRPYIDRVPSLSMYLRWAFYFDTSFAVKTILKGIGFLLKIWIKHPQFLYMEFPSIFSLIKELLRKSPLEKFAFDFLRKSGYKGLILSHSHIPSRRITSDGKIYLNTGTWTDTISLEVGNLGRRTLFTYVELEEDENGNVSPHLMVWKGKEGLMEDFHGEY